MKTDEQYESLNDSYNLLLKKVSEKANINLLIYWLNDDENRKDPELAFTSGNERLLAYHITAMVNRLNHGIGFISQPLETKLLCPKCKASFYNKGNI